MFEVKVSVVTRFADRAVGTGTGLVGAPAPPTLCADAGEGVQGTQDIGDDVREAQDVQADVESDIGDNILDAIANFAEEATLTEGRDVAAAGADGGPALGVFSESASVGELLRVRRTAVAGR
ncbi:hypothetical protein J5Y04_16190 [Kitasatospora sp. RG8]|uniref:hypothetical protein n=1 Tax=Kitasatospora sp. RG8 TaxID=2820815 RepID=UPI001ADF367C|nr:hypothetical protein [Kitasatospora sp. RG8]MBP0451071.1 hypothetical protein [Kitasatospora sp. RG8]